MNYRTTIVLVIALLTAAIALTIAAGQPAEAASSATFHDSGGVADAQARSARLARRPVRAAKGYPRVGPGLERKVPETAIAAAMEDPNTVTGWNQLANTNLPPSPFNIRKRMLTVHDANKHYHPLYNALEFKVGCMQ